MARYKMNWDWAGGYKNGVRCLIYTIFRGGGVYGVMIMLGEIEKGPRDKSWKTGKASNCKSHHDAFKAAFDYTEKEFKEGRT